MRRICLHNDHYDRYPQSKPSAYLTSEFLGEISRHPTLTHFEIDGFNVHPWTLASVVDQSVSLQTLIIEGASDVREVFDEPPKATIDWLQAFSRNRTIKHFTMDPCHRWMDFQSLIEILRLENYTLTKIETSSGILDHAVTPYLTRNASCERKQSSLAAAFWLKLRERGNWVNWGSCNNQPGDTFLSANNKPSLSLRLW